MRRLESERVKRMIYGAVWLVALVGLIVILTIAHSHHHTCGPARPVPPGGIC